MKILLPDWENEWQLAKERGQDVGGAGHRQESGPGQKPKEREHPGPVKSHESQAGGRWVEGKVAGSLSDPLVCSPFPVRNVFPPAFLDLYQLRLFFHF